MTLKIFQLNMWAGTHFDAIKEFLEHHEFDVLCFQEVTGIGVAQGNILPSREFFTKDSFEQLLQLLGNQYRGELAIAEYMDSDPSHAYFGNAICYKKEFVCKKKTILTLFERSTPFSASTTSFEEEGRNALHLLLEKDGKKVNIITAHLAWAKDTYEYPHQRQQNVKLIEYLRSMKKPWVITGDFNMDPHQQSIIDLEKIGRNLTKEYKIMNTIDPVNHHAWGKIKPGFPIDYIFVSPDVRVHAFEALSTIHMSDHIGLTATLSFE